MILRDYQVQAVDSVLRDFETVKAICSVCKQSKPLTDFYKDRSEKRGRSCRCKACNKLAQRAHVARHRERILKRKSLYYGLKYNHGLSPEAFNFQWDKQGKVCAICKQPPNHANSKEKHRLHIDHCHNTGRFRGLLCNRCNRAIGLMRDSAEVCEAAAEYLRRHATS